jgi:hypothetical protein
MGLLTDFFIADPADIETLDISRSPIGEFAAIEGKRTDPVKIVRLQCCIDGSTFEERMPQLNEMLVREAAEDGPWIYRVPPALCEALASARAADLDRYGRAWAATEEWTLDGGTPAEIVPYLGQIAQLASRAKAEQMSLFIWTSL